MTAKTIPGRPDFERIALLLQGGGALGAYQAGVYQALAESGLHPDSVAGISIGAINCALIAGNPPERRVEKLRRFWETVTEPPLGLSYVPTIDIKNDFHHQIVNQWRALGTLLWGAPSFFKPRFPPPIFTPAANPGTLGFYETLPLKTLLESLVDFDRINAKEIRFGVGATNVRNGNFVYFDNMTHNVGPQHVMASGSLPPGFPATEVDGEFYWDGGIVSNTPLQWLLDNRPREDTLAFQVDLWSAHGELPHDMIEVDVRMKDIRYSSRTRKGTDEFRRMQSMRRAAARIARADPSRTAPDGRGRAAGRGGRQQGLQHHPPDLSRQALRGIVEGLRILPPHHGGALEGRLQRHGAHLASSRGAAAAAQRRRRVHLRSQATGPRAGVGT